MKIEKLNENQIRCTLTRADLAERQLQLSELAYGTETVSYTHLYLLTAKVPRFGSGEAKGILGESVRGKDIYIMVDVCNYSLTYSLTGNVNRMSPDDHFQNLKRVIAAVGGKARRINVIMPLSLIHILLL